MIDTTANNCRRRDEMLGLAGGWLLIVLLGVVALTPPLVGPVRLDDFVLLSGLAAAYAFAGDLRMPVGLFYLGCVLLLLFPVSIAMGQLITPVPIVFRDVMWAGFIAKVLLLATYVYSVPVDASTLLEKSQQALIWIGLAAAVVGLLQFGNLLGINEWLTPWYTSQQVTGQQLAEQFSIRRVVGTSSNPNYFAFLMFLPAAASLSSWLCRRQIRFLVAWAVMMVVIAMTLSRTGIVTGVLACGIGYLAWTLKRGRWAMLILFAVCCAIGIWWLASLDIWDSFVLLDRFAASQLDTDGDNSLSVRLERWEEFGSWYYQHPGAWISGVGPQKGGQIDFLDSQYFSLLRVLGLVGLFSIVGMQAYWLCVCTLKFFRTSNSRGEEFALFPLMLLTGLMIFQLAAEPLTDVQGLSVVVIFLALFKRTLDDQPSIVFGMPQHSASGKS
jgi:hypothetical protein